ncbi:MAG: ParA family protein [Ktedonobacteraceae bacterium]
MVQHKKRRISILNYKGGVGKTSLAINLADYFSRNGANVVLVDCDRQRNATSILPKEVQVGPTLLEVLTGEATLLKSMYEARPGLYVVPAHSDLNKAARHLTVNGNPRTLKALKYAIDALEGVDYVLYDHAPSYSTITDAVLLASDEILIPVELETFSIEGLVDMIQKLTEETLPDLEHEVKITGIVPSNLDYTKSMTNQYLTSLKNTFGARVLTGVRTDAQLTKSQSFHQTVFEYNAHAKTVEDYKAIALEIIGVNGHGRQQ